MAESDSTIPGPQTTVRCEGCGRQNPGHSLYCVQCGSPLGRPCLNCATPVAPQARFCSECGTAVVSGLNPMADPEYVGFWARFSAQVIDLVAISLVFGLLGFMLAFVPSVGGLLLTVASLAYLYKNFKNQTPGRMLLKMRVVDRNGQDISLLRGLLRETVGKFVSLSFFGLGFIWVAIDGKKQGWHDKIARTYVIKSTPSQFKIKPNSISIRRDGGPVPVEISGTQGARWQIYPAAATTAKIIAEPGDGEGDGTVYFSWNDRWNDGSNDWDDSSKLSTQTFYIAVNGRGQRNIKVKIAK